MANGKPLSEARKAANKKWNDANLKEKYDRIQLVVPKGEKEVIRAAAEQAGESVNGFIYRLIVAELDRLAKDTGGGSGSSGVPGEKNI